MTIGIAAVGLQHQGNACDKLGLKQVPVVVGHTIGYDVLGPVAQRVVASLLVGGAEQRPQCGVHIGDAVNGILVYHLEGGVSYKRLLLTVVQIYGHMAVVNAQQEGAQHWQRKAGIHRIAGGSIHCGGIAGNT